MRIGVLEKQQYSTEQPKRWISLKRATRLFDRGDAKWIRSGELLQMTREDKEIRGDWRYLKTNLDRPIWIPRLKAPRQPEGLLLSYPIADQRSQPAY